MAMVRFRMMSVQGALSALRLLTRLPHVLSMP